MNVPVSIMETAGEGGPWGMALLASYMVSKDKGQSLGQYLSDRVFAGNEGSRMEPDEEDVKGFEKFIEKYQAGLSVEREAGECL